MLSQRTVTLGNEVPGTDEVTIRQYPTSKSLKYGTSIGKIAGAMLASGLEGGLSEAAEDDILAGMNAGKLVEGLLSQIDEQRTPKLILAMVRDAVVVYQVEGKNVTEWRDAWYEDRFAGALGDLVTLLVAIFEDNFGQAIEVVKKKVRARAGTSGASSQSTILSNGTEPTGEPESTPSFFG